MATVECPDCPVTAEEVAAVLSPTAVPDDRLRLATCSACEMARAYIDPGDIPTQWDAPNSWDAKMTDPAWVWPDPLPARWREGIIGLAIDLYRMATVPFGYFSSDVGLASTGTDPMRRWRTHFSDDKQGWGFA